MVAHRTVLHVSRPTEAGVARFVVDLAQAQANDGWRVVVASPLDPLFVTSLETSGAAHRRWETTDAPGVSTFREIRELRAIVRDIRPDLVHLHASKAGFVGRLRLRRTIPTIFQPHAWSFEAVVGLQGKLSLLWERVAAPRTDVLLCVSEAERERAERAGVRGTFSVVPNGVDLERFPFVPYRDRVAARARLGLDDGPLVVCVGRLCRQKGQDVLLAAWPSVLRAVPGARLVLVGDGPDRARLQASADPTVHLAGHRDDIQEWLAAADVVAVPSRWEGMPYVVLEAMATGRSVVATGADGLEEALGDAGAVVAPDAPDLPDVLARSIVDRLSDPALAEREGQRARARVEERHDARRQLVRVLDLSARLVTERHQ
ncbi:MAG: hypothetical protein QOH10_185 [Actinomycetota bacterium]|jgi:glycosyltransferase involved in cell wall biosynthesis|nr:hypothetical protein [Actinomycetota bacterium]